MSQFLIPPKGGLPKHKNKKSCKSFDLQDSVRRERDSNPRYLSVRRFSRPVHSTTLPSLHRVFEIAVLAVKSNHLKASLHCGERGIRTPGTSQYAGFQDRCIRPLCHLSNKGNAIDVALQSQWITFSLCFISGCKVTLFSLYLQIFGLLFSSNSEKSLISAPLNVTKAITSPLKSTKTSLLVLQCLLFAVTLLKFRIWNSSRLSILSKCSQSLVILNNLDG